MRIRIQKIRQIAFNYLSNINFRNITNLWNNCTAKAYFFLAIDTTPILDYPLRFRKIFLERIYKLIMTIGDKTRDEKLQSISTEKQQKYQFYNQVKMINMNILLSKKYYLLPEAN